MKKYFGMNPEEVQSRSHERDLFGDAYDAYRQAREPEHEADPTRGDAKYNTRIINNLLEMYGFPGNWSKMNKQQKNEALTKLFPDAGEYSYAKGRETIINILDRSFSIYAGRSAPSIAVADLDTFKHFSKKFQEAAITAMSTKRIKDILDPRVSMRDIYDHSQALAQQDGKTWKDMSREERKAYFQKAKENQPELVKKLKFTAAGG